MFVSEDDAGALEHPTGGWTTSTSDGAFATLQSGDSIPPHSGSHFAEIDTTALTSTGNAVASLTQGFTATSIGSIPNTAGSLSLWIYNNGDSPQANQGYCSFQITITASDGSQLIYWWGNGTNAPPANSGTVKYINMGTIANTFTEGQWTQFSRNLQQDWISSGLSSTATIDSITLQNNGQRVSSSDQYGEELFVDDVVLQ